MPSLKFTPRNLEKLGIILMVLLLVFRPGFVKKFSNNLIGKMLLLGAIVSVAAHNKMYGLLAAFTYVVCVEMTSEGKDHEKEDKKKEDEEDDENVSTVAQEIVDKGREILDTISNNNKTEETKKTTQNK